MEQAKPRRCSDCQLPVGTGEVFCPECGYVVAPSDHLVSWSTAITAVLCSLYVPTIPLLFLLSYFNREQDIVVIPFVPFLPMGVGAWVVIGDESLRPLIVLMIPFAVVFVPGLVWLARRSRKFLAMISVSAVVYASACSLLCVLLLSLGLI